MQTFTCSAVRVSATNCSFLKIFNLRDEKICWILSPLMSEYHKWFEYFIALQRSNWGGVNFLGVCTYAHKIDVNISGVHRSYSGRENYISFERAWGILVLNRMVLYRNFYILLAIYSCQECEWLFYKERSYMKVFWYKYCGWKFQFFTKSGKFYDVYNKIFISSKMPGIPKNKQWFSVKFSERAFKWEFFSDFAVLLLNTEI